VIDRPEYYVQTGSMFENPYGVPHDEIVSMILELPAEVAAQVVFGKYVESSGLVFTAELIQQLFDRSLERVVGDTWIDTSAMAQARIIPYQNRRSRYHTGIDFARLNDYTVFFTIDVSSRPARIVYYRRLNRVPWEGIYREVGRCVHMWGPSVIADATGMAGDVILDALQERKFCPIHDRVLTQDLSHCRNARTGVEIGGCKRDQMIPLSCVDGFQFTRSSKQGIIEHLRNILSSGYRSGTDEPFGLLRCPPIVQLEEELSFYSWDDKHLDTDTVMALALACWQGLELAPGESFVGSVYGE
jgi:hypothetical protein